MISLFDGLFQKFAGSERWCLLFGNSDQFASARVFACSLYTVSDFEGTKSGDDNLFTTSAQCFRYSVCESFKNIFCDFLCDIRTICNYRDQFCLVH